ncbi:hypothetical protein UFOVP199_40 [uncultured Caudovirales phage]|uniref:Uncharacterized protein n=1 Tax=uncultured Caudovirales phage TaxID=2100421 RepID=A0A6J7WLQ2_9CAUD|nr:hypothetical protein UFOVP199_40 [uncultured Caudovirales phage]
MNDQDYLKTLHTALARTNDKQERDALLAALDRFLDQQIKRERAIPDMERR